MKKNLSLLAILFVCIDVMSQGINDQLPSRIGYGRHNDPVNRISSLLATALRSTGAPDVLRHKSVLSVEYTTDGTNWLPYTTDDWKNVLDGVSSTGWLLDYNEFRLVIDLEGTWIRPSAFLIGADWGGTDPSYYLKIESSNDAVSWVERLPLTYSEMPNSALNIFFTGDIRADRYIRLSFETEAPANKTFNLKQISAFTQRFVGLSKDAPMPFHFTQDEKVGLGTTTTGSHKLAVDGSIGARQVKVEAGTWSDFVFEDTYKLRSLEETEDYISENKHLPEVPSEEEVVANGIDLGTMDAKLLQKIEELTLYLIEQNKEIKALKAKVEILESK